jgi:hypothetical protein
MFPQMSHDNDRQESDKKLVQDCCIPDICASRHHITVFMSEELLL